MSLSSVLPGLREVRAGLVAGWLYLLLIWLWFAERIEALDDGDGVFARIVEAATAAGPIATLLVASVAAFLVGSLVNWVLRELVLRPVERRFESQISEAGDRLIRAELEAARRAAAASLGAEGIGLDHVTVRALPDVEDVVEEREALRQSLVGTEPDLLAEVDRHGAEAELRGALVLPLAALIITIVAERGEWLWLLLGFAVAGLARQGWLQNRRYGDALADALRRGKATSPAITEFRSSVDEAKASRNRRQTLRRTGTDEAATELVGLLAQDWERALGFKRHPRPMLKWHFSTRVVDALAGHHDAIDELPLETVAFLQDNGAFDDLTRIAAPPDEDDATAEGRAAWDLQARVHARLNPSSPPSA